MVCSLHKETREFMTQHLLELVRLRDVVGWVGWRGEATKRLRRVVVCGARHKPTCLIWILILTEFTVTAAGWECWGVKTGDPVREATVTGMHGGCGLRTRGLDQAFLLVRAANLDRIQQQFLTTPDFNLRLIVSLHDL